MVDLYSSYNSFTHTWWPQIMNIIKTLTSHTTPVTATLIGSHHAHTYACYHPSNIGGNRDIPPTPPPPPHLYILYTMFTHVQIPLKLKQTDVNFITYIPAHEQIKGENYSHTRSTQYRIHTKGNFSPILSPAVIDKN